MWPYQHLDEHSMSSPLNEMEEVDNLSHYSSTPPMSPPSYAPAHNGSDSDSDGFNSRLLEPVLRPRSTTCTDVDLLLLKSIESYVLSVRTPEEIQSTSCLRPPMSQILWPERRRRRARPRSVIRSPSPIPTYDDNQIPSSDESSSEDTIEFMPAPDSLPPMPTVRCSDPATEPSNAMRRFRSVQNMPQPNILAQQVANRLLKFARTTRNLHEDDLCCLTCGMFPICPVTEKCGHTRCTKCIEIKGNCPCGNDPEEPFFVNIVIRDVVENKKADITRSRIIKTAMASKSQVVSKLINGRGSCSGPIRTKRKTRLCTVSPFTGRYRQHIPMSARARFAHAVELVHAGRHRDAAPQLALAGASNHSDLRVARTLLAQVIMVLSTNRDPRTLTRELYHSIRHLSSIAWIKPDDMECILCCDTFTQPVTTPCGHMFCRTCLEKTLDYKKRCPLCLRPLVDFKLGEVNDTIFVTGALAAINALNIPKPMEEDDLVPIFVCTVAYPSVPCPLFIFDPRYWLMIRRVLESGSRRFGMVACDREKRYADYGTILEVRDCVHLEDGRSILSTVGLSRFKVMERSVRDGCEVARIQPINDSPPVDSMATDDLKVYASQIMLKAILWLSQLSAKILSDIESAFGTLPTARDGDNEEWWESADGPAWLWWLVAVLPLRTEIKVLILSTDCLIKRMMAVARTLEAVETVTLTTTTPGQYEIEVGMPSNA